MVFVKRQKENGTSLASDLDHAITFSRASRTRLTSDYKTCRMPHLSIGKPVASFTAEE